MNIILLSGGSGKRLWPMSNDIRSKQFHRIFKNDEGEYESMVQRMYRGIREVAPDANITVATSGDQVSLLRDHLKEDEKISISVEPARRDTFPAIALATAYIVDKMGAGRDEVIVVCPVDPYVDENYFKALKELRDLAADGESNLTLLGIEPTYPSDRFGYIIPRTEDEITTVDTFKEKPDEETAKDYISRGALWNGGVFAYKAGYVLDRAKEITGYCEHESLFENYGSLERISFDYAVAEHEDNIRVMRYSGVWQDLGTWDTLTEILGEAAIGTAVMDDCEDVNVINETNVPIILKGLKNVVVFSSPDGILIADKKKSADIKPLVEKLTH